MNKVPRQPQQLAASEQDINQQQIEPLIGYAECQRFGRLVSDLIDASSFQGKDVATVTAMQTIATDLAEGRCWVEYEKVPTLADIVPDNND